jgi:N utilization substance protein A
VFWFDDPARYVAEALSPAEVLSVRIDEERKIANVIVPERQLSLAIGKEGQNARLAAKLTGWRIDIRSDTGVAQAAASAGSTPDPIAAPIGAGDSTLDAEDDASSDEFAEQIAHVDAADTAGPAEEARTDAETPA